MKSNYNKYGRALTSEKITHKPTTPEERKKTRKVLAEALGFGSFVSGISNYEERESNA